MRSARWSGKAVQTADGDTAGGVAESRESALIIHGSGTDESLRLVSTSVIKNKTVVTVMDKAALKENVFTNIDSTIVM